MKNPIAAVCVGLILFLPISGTTQSPVAPFSILISVQEPVSKVGAPVVVKVTVRNILNHDIAFFDTSRYCDYTIDVRDSGGLSAPETEFKRSLKCSPGADIIHGRRKLVRLKPNATIDDELVVTEMIDLSRPGEYTVRVSRKAPPELGGSVVESNSITVTIK